MLLETRGFGVSEDPFDVFGPGSVGEEGGTVFEVDGVAAVVVVKPVKLDPVTLDKPSDSGCTL
jgi:hypothetical protein